MTPNNNYRIMLKHSLALVTVAGIFVEQTCRTYAVVGLSAVSVVYCCSLLAFYSILYAYEAGFIRFSQDYYRRRLQLFKLCVLVLNVLLSFMDYLRHAIVQYPDLMVQVLEGVFSVFIVLFPELLLPVIFGIADEGG